MEQAKKWKEKIQTFGIKEWGVFLIIGICCFLIVLPAKTSKNEKEETLEQYVERKEEELDYVTKLEQRLIHLLSCVQEVGEVNVMITVESTMNKNVLQDETKETEKSTEQDSAGGSRNLENIKMDNTTVFAQNQPYVVSETYPKVTGVVVIAQGSGKGTVDYDILNAVQVLFDVPAHKIKIMKMK